MFFTGISDEAGGPIERQIAAHQELGWSSLELRGIDGVNLTSVDDDIFEYVFRSVKEAGMTVCCFASQLANWSRPISADFQVDKDELARAIPRMQRMGTKYIRCMSYPNAGLPDDAWRDEVVRRLQVLAKMAEDGGVILAHENCDGWGGQGPVNSLELLERVNNPAFKLCFDTGNPVAHRQNALEYLRAVADHVVHVHIKDGKRTPDDTGHIYTFPGEGECQVEECIRLLISHGYDGGYSIEPHIAAVVHLGDLPTEERAQAMWDSYIKYGKKHMALFARAVGKVG